LTELVQPNYLPRLNIAKMRHTIVILLIAFVAFAAAQDHCLDKAFTTRVILINPHDRYEDMHRLYYDSTTNKQRLDIFEDLPELRSRHIFLRYDLGKQFNFNNHTKECDIHPLQGKLEQFCLAKNATKQGSYVLGDPSSGLKVDLWEERIFGWNLRIGVASQTGIPVNLLSRGGTHHGERPVFEEWVDFEHGVKDQSVFELPKECVADRKVVARNAMSDDFAEILQSATAVIRRNL
jgi:hypothetical protein